jgi:hypothetical protein
MAPMKMMTLARAVKILQKKIDILESSSPSKGRHVAKERSNLGGFVVYRELRALF